MASHPTAIHLCSGYGGFELALRDWGVRTVAHVERDSYAASILMERMAQSRLDQAPIWDDLTTFDGERWCGRVDLITAGFPCQPFSAAGARRGLDDDRWLWPAIARIVAQVRPRFVVLENVPPVVRAGLPAVLADLANNGFDAQWGLYSAADVGAPHRRQRWWCVAHANGHGLSGERWQSNDDRNAWANPDRRNSSDVAYAASSGRPQDRLNDTGNSATPSSSRASGNADGGGSAVADTVRQRCQGQARPERPNGNPAGHRFPPTRDDTDGWQQWINEGGPQPVVRRLADGPPAGLADALHLGGNGLVPQAATAAIRQLLERGGWQL